MVGFDSAAIFLTAGQGCEIDMTAADFLDKVKFDGKHILPK